MSLLPLKREEEATHQIKQAALEAGKGRERECLLEPQKEHRLAKSSTRTVR